MNEKVESQLLEILKSTQETGSDIVAFLYEQTPLLVQDILRYNFVSNLSGVIMSLAFLIGIYKAIKFVFFTHSDVLEEKDVFVPLSILTFFISILGGIFGLVIFLCSIDNLYKVYFAPRLFIFEYVANLIN